MTTCCKISSFLKTTAKKLRGLLFPQPKSWGTNLPRSLRLLRLWRIARIFAAVDALLPFSHRPLLQYVTLNP